MLDQRGGRVQAAPGRGGGPAVGSPQEQAQHELRQAQPGSQILLRQEGGDVEGLTSTLKRADGPSQEGESTDRAKQGAGTAAGATKQSSRNDYIHSGLYTSFHLNSLQNGCQLFKSIKMENPAEKMADKRGATASQEAVPPPPPQAAALPSVIKFGNSPPKPAPPPPVLLEPALLPAHLDPLQAAPHRPEDASTHAPLPPPSLYPFQHTRPSEAAFGLPGLTSASPAPSLLDTSQELGMDSGLGLRSSHPADSQAPDTVHQVDSDIGLSGDESLVDAETSSSSVSSSTTVSNQVSGKTRKPPKILQISPPTLLVTASDFSPMNICSPSLPTASLTPAMLQTPTLLLTPSPLLSNIHFWSTLSPVAPLSPATRRQGGHLFQFPSVLNPQFQIPVHSLDGTNTPGPISPDPQKT
ncbi:ETS domain-containing protein Elk-4 isoform 5-T6 [Menidia menidia]